MNGMWVVFALCVLLISGVVGLHLGRFREAYTEMSGMMAGMTMGMLNGFLLGYASAAATSMSMFWGNIFGILLGLALGVYFGRAGGLMGILDGGMGGVMGGSMGAMLAVMVAFPREGIYWTALLLAVIYLLGMAGLVALIEQSSPEHAAMHRVLPMFTRALASEASEEIDARERIGAASTPQITDYYAFLGIRQAANTQEISDAYLARLATEDEAGIARAEMALATLTDPRKREVYDRRLKESRAANSYDKRGDCCPPPRRGKQGSYAQHVPIQGTSARVTSPPATSAVAARSAVPVAQGAARPKGHVSAEPAARSRVRRVPYSGAGATQQREVPISWVGVLAGAVLAVMLAAWWLVSQGTAVIPAAPTTSQLEAQAVVAKVGDDGKQTLDFVVNGYTLSYEPKAIKVRKGVPVRFNISQKGPDAGCTRFIAIRDLNVHGVSIRDRVTNVDFVAEKAGVYEINCEMRMTPPSYLIVTD